MGDRPWRAVDGLEVEGVTGVSWRSWTGTGDVRGSIVGKVVCNQKN